MDESYSFPPPGAALSGNDKHVLRGRAQTIKPALILGKEGVTPAVLKEFELALKRDALVKIRAAASRDELKLQCRTLAESSGAECLGTVGRTASFYRAKPMPGEFDEE